MCLWGCVHVCWKGQQGTVSGVVPREPSTLVFYLFLFKLKYFDFLLLFCAREGSTCMYMDIIVQLCGVCSLFTSLHVFSGWKSGFQGWIIGQQAPLLTDPPHHIPTFEAQCQ